MVAELAIVLVVIACSVTNFPNGVRQLIARKIEIRLVHFDIRSCTLAPDKDLPEYGSDSPYILQVYQDHEHKPASELVVAGFVCKF
jgi:hypothetical protein